MTGARGEAWGDAIAPLLEPRTRRPRTTGITAVMDKGLGLRAVDDLVEMAGPLIDYVKLGFGTTAPLSAGLVMRKVARLVKAGIVVYPGGTLLEAAWTVGSMPEFIARARELGFTAVEVSDGTVDLPEASRRDAIRRVQDAGLEVITEVGRKDPQRQLSTTEMVDRVHADLDEGVSLVTIEARESGRGTGIFDQSGKVIGSVLETLLTSIRDPARVLWEAPLQDQQTHLILRCGANVNLANIAPGEVLALEALRRGFRFDTLRAAIQREVADGPPKAAR
jgi:phosphosulfolactate synthase